MFWWLIAVAIDPVFRYGNQATQCCLYDELVLVTTAMVSRFINILTTGGVGQTVIRNRMWLKIFDATSTYDDGELKAWPMMPKQGEWSQTGIVTGVLLTYVRTTG